MNPATASHLADNAYHCQIVGSIPCHNYQLSFCPVVSVKFELVKINAELKIRTEKTLLLSF
jgi:hypothetical protein